ncbi:ABC transporter permease [Kribbella soli]|uniref:ABC transporter permease n=1 Tax=Kribbella soli TaxID=1124743 RepID=A0A4R0H3N6_9ACTN|nr:ABC-2 family transporter protein [Kribbella soli]TCC04258.1 ABC transporter permease [Kribbella soli]
MAGNTLTVFRVLIRLSLASELQYRGNLLQSLIGGAAAQATQLLLIGVILNSFGAIGGWSASEIMLLVGLRMAGHAVYAFFFRRVIDNDRVVHTGEFDRYLLRPISPFLQLLTRQFNLQQLGDVVIAAAVLGTAVRNASIDWNVGLALFCGASVIGGGLIEASLQTLRAAAAFRLKNTDALTGTIDSLVGTYSNFPLQIFGGAASAFFTFAVPLAFIAWAPAAVLLNRGADLGFPTEIAWATPAYGPILMTFAVAIYHLESRHYSSPGS